MTDKNKKSNISAWIILALILFLIIGGMTTCCVFAANKELPSNEPFSRSATNNDIYIDLSEEISLSITYEIVPQVDIKNLEITFKYHTKENKVLSTKIKNIGNVKKGINYPVSVSLGEFSFLDIFKINSTSANVTGGTVSIFK